MIIASYVFISAAVAAVNRIQSTYNQTIVRRVKEQEA